jgi:triosephosphate isomerase
MHATIRAYLKEHTAEADQISLLYGGSVKPENAVQLATCRDIDGALVGGASLEANSFMAIIDAFSQSALESTI